MDLKEEGFTLSREEGGTPRAAGGFFLSRTKDSDPANDVVIERDDLRFRFESTPRFKFT